VFLSDITLHFYAITSNVQVPWNINPLQNLRTTTVFLVLMLEINKNHLS